MWIEACRYGESSELQYLVHKDKTYDNPKWIEVSQLKGAKQALVKFLRNNENHRPKRVNAKEEKSTQNNKCPANPATTTVMMKTKGLISTSQPIKRGRRASTNGIKPTSQKSDIKQKPGRRHARSNSAIVSKSTLNEGILNNLPRKTSEKSVANSTHQQKLGNKVHVRRNTTGSLNNENISLKRTDVNNGLKSNSFRSHAIKVVAPPLNTRMTTSTKVRRLGVNHVFNGNKTIINNNNKGEPLRRRNPKNIDVLSLNVLDSQIMKITSLQDVKKSSTTSNVTCLVPLTSDAIPLNMISMAPVVLATAGTVLMDVKRKTIQNIVKHARTHMSVKRCRPFNTVKDVGTRKPGRPFKKVEHIPVKRGRPLKKVESLQKSLKTPLIPITKHLKLEIDSQSETSTDSGEIVFMNLVSGERLVILISSYVLYNI